MTVYRSLRCNVSKIINEPDITPFIEVHKFSAFHHFNSGEINDLVASKRNFHRMHRDTFQYSIGTTTATLPTVPATPTRTPPNEQEVIPKKSAVSGDDSHPFLVQYDADGEFAFNMITNKDQCLSNMMVCRFLVMLFSVVSLLCFRRSRKA